MKEAARIAGAHHPRLRGRTYTKVELGATKQVVRNCIEILHESFAVPEFIQLRREHGIGLAVADTVKWPLLMDVTADFVYSRAFPFDHHLHKKPIQLGGDRAMSTR
jgi:hypothetical protein